MIPFIYTGLVLLTFACIVIPAIGLSHALKQTGYPVRARKRVLSRSVAAIVSWLLFTEFLERSGVLSHWESVPPRLPFVPLTALVCLIVVNRIPSFKRLIVAIPRHWPVAMQTFRIGVELALCALFAAKVAPIQVTFEGRNFDALVGLSAPILAFLIAKKNLAPRFVIAWNLLSIAILGNTIFTVLTSIPGPIHGNWPDEPFTAIATWPMIWIPAFLAPFALFLHIVSIRQNLAALPKA